MNLINLDGIDIPYFKEEGGEIYYPIKYIHESFLMKTRPQIHKDERYKDYIKRYIIDFTFKGTVPQETYCMNKEGWIKYLNKCKNSHKKNEDKIRRLNILLEYFGENKFKQLTKEYDYYTKLCIDEYVKFNTNVEYKECLTCKRELPISNHFFDININIKGGYTNVCKECSNGRFMNYNDEYNYIHKMLGVDWLKEYEKDKIMFYVKYIKSKENINIRFPKDDNELLKKLIKKLYIDGYLLADELSFPIIKNKIKNVIFKGYGKFTANHINDFCSNGECKLRPWLYPKYILGNIKDDYANELFTRYIEDNNIVIDNPLEYKDYQTILMKSRLTQFKHNILGFLVKYYNYEYPGYMFKIRGENYYKDKEARIFDMKYLIEKDLKLEIIKIPLYITKTFLHNKSNKLTYIMRSIYKNNLFEWINECYPNLFTIHDFHINQYRSEFDSLEEAQVNDVLKSKFDGVIYNSRNNENTVNISGMVPDWIIVSDKGCILVEYFGLYQENSDSSSRLTKYKEKLAIKLEKYKELERAGYRTLYIYPEDIRGDFGGLLKKIDDLNL